MVPSLKLSLHRDFKSGVFIILIFLLLSPELDLMDIDLLTRMEGLVGGVLISPAKSKVKNLLDSLVGGSFSIPIRVLC